MRVGEGELVSLPVVLDGESAAVQGAHEAPIPMEVDSETRLSLLGDPEYESRPTYADVVAGTRAIATGQLTAPSQGSAGIEGALNDEAFSFVGPPE